VAAASLVIDMDEVFVARIASLSQIASSSCRTARLIGKFSFTSFDANYKWRMPINPWPAISGSGSIATIQ